MLDGYNVTVFTCSPYTWHGMLMLRCSTFCDKVRANRCWKDLDVVALSAASSFCASCFKHHNPSSKPHHLYLLIVNACAPRLGSRAGPRTGKEERGLLQKREEGSRSGGRREVKGVKGV